MSRIKSWLSACPGDLQRSRRSLSEPEGVSPTRVESVDMHMTADMTTPRLWMNDKWQSLDWTLGLDTLGLDT
eukprot:587794-Pyramimonas_sp.AAC.2